MPNVFDGVQQEQQVGYFPVVLGGMAHLGGENFMKKQDVVSNLKLRAGWGVVGNDRITNYLSLELYSQGKYGYGNNVITVLSPKQLPESIKWGGLAEITNIGIDLGLFRNRLNVTTDFFLKGYEGPADGRQPRLCLGFRVAVDECG